MFSNRSGNGVFDDISLFAAELKEPKTGISGKTLIEGWSMDAFCLVSTPPNKYPPNAFGLFSGRGWFQTTQ